MLVLEKQEKYDGHQQFFAIVQLIGSRKQAENFAYRWGFPDFIPTIFRPDSQVANCLLQQIVVFYADWNWTVIGEG